MGVIGPRLDNIRSNIEDKCKKTPGMKRNRVKNFDVICPWYTCLAFRCSKISCHVLNDAILT